MIRPTLPRRKLLLRRIRKPNGRQLHKSWNGASLQPIRRTYVQSKYRCVTVTRLGMIIFNGNYTSHETTTWWLQLADLAYFFSHFLEASMVKSNFKLAFSCSSAMENFYSLTLIGLDDYIPQQVSLFRQDRKFVSLTIERKSMRTSNIFYQL